MSRRGAQTMQLTIRITCDSPPFEDDPIGEIERVLKQLVFRLGEDRYATHRGTNGKLLDSSGYTVGDFVLNVPRENRPNLTTEETLGDS
jgi:hypothetical protein